MACPSGISNLSSVSIEELPSGDVYCCSLCRNSSYALTEFLPLAIRFHLLLVTKTDLHISDWAFVMVESMAHKARNAC